MDNVRQNLKVKLFEDLNLSSRIIKNQQKDPFRPSRAMLKSFSLGFWLNINMRYVSKPQ